MQRDALSVCGGGDGGGGVSVNADPRASVLIHLLNCCGGPTLCIYLGVDGGCQAA